MSDPEQIEAAAVLLDSLTAAAATLDGLKNQDAKRILKQVMEDAATHIGPPKKQAQPATVTPIGRPL